MSVFEKRRKYRKAIKSLDDMLKLEADKIALYNKMRIALTRELEKL